MICIINFKRAIIEDRLLFNLPLDYKETIYDLARFEFSPSLLLNTILIKELISLFDNIKLIIRIIYLIFLYMNV